MAFSGALTLTDLNDFITPSQACIKPVEQVQVPKETIQEASTEIRIDSAGSYYEVAIDGVGGRNKPASRKLEQAQISLNDCLACSGCITSAESVLITLQSHTEMLNVLETNASITPASKRKIPIVSIAPQSLASFAAALSYAPSSSSAKITTPRQILRRLRTFCEAELGFAYVFDTTFARHIALHEHVKEFCERRERRAKNSNDDPSDLPMLASACPGWICYAEKTHAEMLPFIARTKSPQQVMGTLVKEWIGARLGKSPDEVYHVTVMPCYDKKLEASRSDFYNEIYSTRDVDCVITTGELELLLHEKDFDISLPVSGELDPPSQSAFELPELVRHAGSSSGSYIQAVIDYIVASSPTPLDLTVKQIRNAEYEEYTLKKRHDPPDLGEVVFKGAKCYGFRNLQNIVRKIGKERGLRTGTGAAGRMNINARRFKKSASTESDGRGIDYVEIMACPGGCVNGGGQLKPRFGESGGEVEDLVRVESDVSNPRWGNKAWTKLVEAAYWSDREGVGNEGTEGVMARVFDELARKVASGLPASELFRTEYRAVSNDLGLSVQW